MTPTEDLAQLWSCRMKSRYPRQAARYNDEQIRKSMVGWLGLMENLGFTEHEEQVRYLSLCVLLSPEQRQSKLVQGTLQRVLSNLTWEPSQRLDFIYAHLVGRPVSGDEEDFGPQLLFLPPESLRSRR